MLLYFMFCYDNVFHLYIFIVLSMYIYSQYSEELLILAGSFNVLYIPFQFAAVIQLF